MNSLLQYRGSALKTAALCLGACMACCNPAAAQATAPAPSSGISNPVIMISLVVIAFLTLVILILGYAVIGAKNIYAEKMKAEKETARQQGMKVFTAGSLLVLSSLSCFAQDKKNLPAGSIAGMAPSNFYAIVTVLVAQLIVILALVQWLKFLAGIKSKPWVLPALPDLSAIIKRRWNQMNRSVAIEQEKDIDLSHDYDGIRELDNTVPPWWKWTFIATICFGMVYLWRFHIGATAPLQLEEYNLVMQQAEKDKADYLRLSAANVDEQSVKMLDAAGIESGKALFKANCIACHGAEGQGLVGPNLTDDYWLHDGRLGGVFSSIKYGWVDKGMKAWKDDLTPVQIAQLSSYIKSIHNSNPSNARAPQGEKLEEEKPPVTSDSSKTGKQTASL